MNNQLTAKQHKFSRHTPRNKLNENSRKIKHNKLVRQAKNASAM
uniref:Uncharacterized protein n=1 Tax=Rhizophora mucronata TaxID=61149 RepID=A0A2P2ISQ5_RHIMU